MSYRRVPSPSNQTSSYSPLTLPDTTVVTFHEASSISSEQDKDLENTAFHGDPQSLSTARRLSSSFLTPRAQSPVQYQENISLKTLNSNAPSSSNHFRNNAFSSVLSASASSASSSSSSSRTLLNNKMNSPTNPFLNPLLPPLRRLYILLEDPSSSKYAFYFSIFIGFMIILSCFVATIETIPSLYTNHEDLWIFREGLEIFIIIVFSFEYTLRVIANSESWSSMWRFVLSPLGILDLLAILPYYIESMLYASSARDQAHMSYVFRTTILKMFRLFRLFRVFKHSSLIQLSIEVLIIALKRSIDALSALFLFIVISLVVFSTLLYFAERGTWDPEQGAFLIDGKPSQFDSIPSSFWFVMVTLTTVGYGDLVPKTFVGKLISFPAMLCGILLIALPSIIVGRNFSIVWEHMRGQRTNSEGNLTTNLNSSATGLGPIPQNPKDLVDFIQHLVTRIQQHQEVLKEAVESLQLQTALSTPSRNHYEPQS